MQPMEPFMRKGGFLYTKVRVLNIFKTTEEADSANLAEMKKSRPLLKKKELAEFNKKWADMETNLAAQQEQTAKDSKIIEDYLAKNNIKATRTKWGTYVAIHTEGTGDPVTSESIVKVNYTGKTLDSSKVFDSNTDPKFNHVEPYQLSVGQSIGSVVPGWTDALLQLKNGTKATIYLPSALGYGKGGRAPSIKPDEILVFEMDVIDVQTEDQLMAQAEAERAKLKEREKAVQDSLKRTK
jgi:FKBP-type peptidyl-prolyl cis-trans isomerase